jgi:LysM repeat protein
MSSAHSSAHNNRTSVKIRRRGRHAAPSQVEKIAGKATVAAPAVAIAGGVIIGLPATAGAATTGTAAVSAPAPASTASHAQAAKATLDAVTSADRTYDVQSGDTLSGIARHFYGAANDWHYLYQRNTATISNPNLIYPGQVLNVPSGAPSTASEQAPASASGTGQAPASASGTEQAPMSASTADSAQGSASGSSGSASAPANVSASVSSGSLSGTLGCSGLEQLWEEAGGSPSEAFMAAEIAMAESGGNQYAVSPTADYGYWQINSSHGSMATFNALGNAQAAVSISSDGTNWDPWTTFQTGAYSGKC